MRAVNLSGPEPGRNYLKWNFVTERTIANAAVCDARTAVR
jgi:hypothetical protein